jgi:GNAT superfamily N-acetyltransferase
MTDKHKIFDHLIDTEASFMTDRPFQVLTGTTRGVISGLASPLFNCVCLGQPETALLQKLRAEKIPTLLFATESFEQNFSQFAQEQDLTFLENVTAQQYLVPEQVSYRPDQNLKIQLVTTQEQLAIFDEISSVAFQHDKGMATQFLQSSLSSNKVRLFIAAVEDVFVGCCMISFVNDRAGFYWDGVLPAYRGKGLASEMTKYRMGYVKDHGYKNICVQNLSTSLSYYQKLGFKPVGTLPLYLLTW